MNKQIKPEIGKLYYHTNNSLHYSITPSLKTHNLLFCINNNFGLDNGFVFIIINSFLNNVGHLTIIDDNTIIKQRKGKKREHKLIPYTDSNYLEQIDITINNKKEFDIFSSHIKVSNNNIVQYTDTNGNWYDANECQYPFNYPIIPTQYNDIMESMYVMHYTDIEIKTIIDGKTRTRICGVVDKHMLFRKINFIHNLFYAPI